MNRQVKIVLKDFGNVPKLGRKGMSITPVTSNGVKLTGEKGLNEPAL
jgi:hypothetical protein